MLRFHKLAIGLIGTFAFIALSAEDSRADLFDDLSDRYAHRHLDKSAVRDLSGQRKHFCAFAFFRTQFRERLRAVPHDPRDGGVCFAVVHKCGMSPKPFFGRIGRSENRHPAFPLDGGDKRGFLSADERPGSLHDPER